MVDYVALAEAINRLSMDSVFCIDDGVVVDAPVEVYTPDVVNDDVNDVVVDSGWSTIRGFTGQDSYNGSVMHPSEHVGSGIAEHLAEDYDPGTVFAIVEVRDNDGSYPEGDAIGWAIAYRNGE